MVPYYYKQRCTYCQALAAIEFSPFPELAAVIRFSLAWANHCKLCSLDSMITDKKDFPKASVHLLWKSRRKSVTSFGVLELKRTTSACQIDHRFYICVLGLSYSYDQL